jgi:lipopolysaccharide export system permease protein
MALICVFKASPVTSSSRLKYTNPSVGVLLGASTRKVINVSGTGSELVRTDSEYRTDREMDIAQMEEHVGRAVDAAAPIRERIRDFLRARFDYLYGDTFVCSTPDTVNGRAALGLVRSDAAMMVRHVERNNQQINAQKRIMDKYSIEIHKKYSIPAASLAFILIGAPLGILAKRGGMGMAIAIAILLFIIYWAFLIGGEDIADRGLVSPFWAMWSANILVGASGLYLNYVVVSEKPILSFFRRIN